MTSTYRKHFEVHHYKEWREIVIANKLKGWESLARKGGVAGDTVMFSEDIFEPFTFRGLARRIAHWIAADDQVSPSSTSTIMALQVMLLY